jgi:dihydrofolate reductase
MARLIYSGLMSVDGYIADRDGNFDWAEPDAEVHSFVNELMRPVATHLLGRRMYEVMAVWEHGRRTSARSPTCPLTSATSPTSGRQRTRWSSPAPCGT